MSDVLGSGDFFLMKTEVEAKQLNYEFDRFRVDTSAFRLLKDDSPVSIEPKALQLLIFLIENRGRLLGKQEILDAVWGDLSVTENALTREVAILRRALSDDTRQPRFIETVPTRGYRFVANVFEGPREPNSEVDGTEFPVPSDSSQRSKLALLTVTAVAAMILITVIAFTARRFLERNFGPLTSRSSLVQVTSSSGLDVFPSFSPDGNTIAYSSDATGNFEIYIRPISAQGKELQITSDGQANVEPSYSPDGQWIAYHSRIRNGIWIIPALGGVARRLTEFGSHPAWSHDGARIAFASGDIGAILETEAGASPESSIWIVKVSDGSLHQLTRPSDTPGPTMFGHSTPQWTREDRRILFAAAWMLWTVSVDGADVEPVARGVFGYDPVLSADGRKIWFVGGSAAEAGIWVMPVDERGRSDGAPALVHSVPPGTGHYLAASASDNRLAFVQMNTHDNLYSIALNTKHQSGPEPITSDTRLRKTNPGISPNGKLVSFGVAQIGLPNQIWITDMEHKRTAQVPITTGAGSPAWLSDNELSYWTFSKNSAQLWKWTISEGRATLIVDSGEEDIECVRLSPDGRTAAFQRKDHGTMNVWSLSPEDKRIRQLTFNQSPVGWPLWSRNGQSLAVEVKVGANANIGVMDANGGPITMITHDAGQHWPYSWSPDGEQIAFAGFRNGTWNVFSVSVRTGAQTQLTKYSAANTFVRYPEWSPAGDRIVYEYGETTGNIWMLKPSRPKP